MFNYPPLIRGFYRAAVTLLLSISFFTSVQWEQQFFQLEDYFFLFAAGLLLFIFLLQRLLSDDGRDGGRWYMTRLDAALSLLISYILLRLIFSDAGEGWLYGYKLAGCFLLYLSLKCIFRQAPFLRRYSIQLMLLIGLVQAALGILQYAGFLHNKDHLFKIGGTFGNPGVYGDYLALLIPVALSRVLAGLRSGEQLRVHYISYGLLTLGIVVLPFTGARTAWLACLVSTIYLLSRYDPAVSRVKNLFRSLSGKLLVGGLLIIAGLASAGGLYKFKQASAQGRLFIWGISARMIGDHPLWGMGPDAFGVKYNLYQADFFKGKEEMRGRITAGDTNVAFDEYIQVWVEYGLGGLVLLTAVIFAVFEGRGRFRGRRGREKMQDNARPENLMEKEGLYAAQIAWLVLALASYPFHLIHAVVNLVFLLAMLDYRKAPFLVFKGKATKHWKDGRKGIRMTLIFLALVCFSLYYSGRKYDHLLAWKTADAFFSANDTARAFSAYRGLYPALSGNPVYCFDYGTKLYLHGDYGAAIPLFQAAARHLSTSYLYTYIGICHMRQRQYAEAASNLELASRIAPRELLPKYYLFKVFRAEGDSAGVNRMRAAAKRMGGAEWPDEMDVMRREMLR